MITRRKFFTSSALAAGGLAGFPQLGRPADSPIREGRPGRIIHLVADGMSMGTLTGADYLSWQLRGHGLTWLKLMQEPATQRALMNMRSLSSMVTDSAAASSSWGSGSRVANGAINRLPSGRELTTLFELFASHGWKRGLVTTTEITHATPAGFAACVDSRETGDLIATQYLERRVDVLLGGGQKFFDPLRRRDKRDLRKDFAAAGYVVMESASDLAQASTDRSWLGIFYPSHLPFMIDQIADAKLEALVPTLPAMTRRALDWLGRHEHFILQIEGGRVDHAAHNCDAPAAFREMLAFDEAIDLVLAFQRERPDTLVVITTDHGTGNPGVNGTGEAYNQSSPMFKRVADVKASLAEILRRLRRQPAERVASTGRKTTEGASESAGNAAGWNRESGASSSLYVPGVKEIQSVIGTATGYEVPRQQAKELQTFLARKGSCVYGLMNTDVAQLGQLLANHIAVGWAGSVHTADFVPLTAIGLGAERFAGFIQNVDIFRHYTQLAGIDFKNPEEPMMARAGRSGGTDENLAEYAQV